MNENVRQLGSLGQSIWLDSISRQLLRSGTLARYIDELSVTGLTSNPTTFENTIGADNAYDDSIRVLAAADLSGEEIVPVGRVIFLPRPRVQSIETTSTANSLS